jgi:hypothetical protein
MNKDKNPRKPKVYIAGPMTGKEFFNFPAFDKAAEKLRAAGYDPINPADLDRVAWHFAGYPTQALMEEIKKQLGGKEAFVKSCISRDITAILSLKDGDALYLLKGWHKSVGAKGEKAVTEWVKLACNIDIIYEGGLNGAGL